MTSQRSSGWSAITTSAPSIGCHRAAPSAFSPSRRLEAMPLAGRELRWGSSSRSRAMRGVSRSSGRCTTTPAVIKPRVTSGRRVHRARRRRSAVPSTREQLGASEPAAEAGRKHQRADRCEGPSSPHEQRKEIGRFLQPVVGCRRVEVGPRERSPEHGRGGHAGGPPRRDVVHAVADEDSLAGVCAERLAGPRAPARDVASVR